MTRIQVMEAMMKSTKSAMDGLQDKINEMNKKLDLIMELYAEFLDAVEKEEQKTGRWVDDCYLGNYNWMCTNCEAHHRAMYDYCPTCGAKMQKE